MNIVLISAFADRREQPSVSCIGTSAGAGQMPPRAVI